MFRVLKTTNTGRHIITVRQLDDVYEVCRQPINPRTGRPWRVNAPVRGNCDVHKAWFNDGRQEVYPGRAVGAGAYLGAWRVLDYFSTPGKALHEAERLAKQDQAPARPRPTPRRLYEFINVA